MATFNPKQSYVGIDIGTSSIKAVQLGNDNGRPRLMTYGYIEQPNDIVKSDAATSREAVVAALRTVIREARISTTKAVAALPSFTVFNSIISLPVMTRKELNSAVRFEAKKFVPLPIEELSLDWKLLRDTSAPAETDKAPKSLRVLITAAPKNLVKRYIEIFKTTGLEIVDLETEAWALERSLIGTEPAPVMIVDIGAVATDIAIFVDGIPLITRSIDVGGNSMTASIAQSLNVDVERAEQFKRDFGLSLGSGGSTQVPKTVEFVMSQIMTEIKWVLDLYRRGQGQGRAPVEKIVLAGGSAFLLNLPEYLEKILSIKTFIGDPWARVVYPLELKSVLQEIGPRFAVAIGLAMRELVP